MQEATKRFLREHFNGAVGFSTVDNVSIATAQQNVACRDQRFFIDALNEPPGTYLAVRQRELSGGAILFVIGVGKSRDEVEAALDANDRAMALGPANYRLEAPGRGDISL
jgi:hypothetical protein